MTRWLILGAVISFLLATYGGLSLIWWQDRR